MNWFPLALVALLIVAFIGFYLLQKRMYQKIAVDVFEANQQRIEKIEALLAKGVADDVANKLALKFDAIARTQAATTDALTKIPTKVLNTLQGSANTTTGKLGELITFIELQRAYDRLIAVGDIVDFLGIRFPVGDLPGAIDFIDVKTGDKAQLNADQKKLRTLIDKNKEAISFKVVKVDIT